MSRRVDKYPDDYSEDNKTVVRNNETVIIVDCGTRTVDAGEGEQVGSGERGEEESDLFGIVSGVTRNGSEVRWEGGETRTVIDIRWEVCTLIRTAVGIGEESRVGGDQGVVGLESQLELVVGRSAEDHHLALGTSGTEDSVERERGSGGDAEDIE